jgi:hypothetical protein
LSNVRQFFDACGDVVAVEFVAERSPGRLATSAYVTMATTTGAKEAVRTLHGRLFHDRSVMVTLGHGSESGSREDRKRKESPASVSMAQQYRDRHGMIYELDCEGLRLTLRFFFPEEGGNDARRVEATTNQGAQLVVEATAPTRELALAAVAEAWGRLPAEPPAPTLDWTKIAAVLRVVRAV